MPLLENIPFGGLSGRKAPNLLELPEALYADDCFLDTDAITGRNGYRACSAAAAGSGGACQHIGRFRPTADSARTVIVLGGSIYLLTDPSSESASDGTVGLLLSGAFGVTDIVSGACLGSSYYLSTDYTGGVWYRIDSNYALLQIAPLPPPGPLPVPGLSAFPIAWTLFSGMAAPTVSVCKMYASSDGWEGIAGVSGSGVDPPLGAYANFDLSSRATNQAINGVAMPENATFDARGYDWLVVGVSPHTQGSEPLYDYGVIVSVSDQPAATAIATDWQKLGTVYDTPVQFGSPNCILLDIRGLDPAVRAAIRSIQFQNDPSQADAGRYIVYGLCFLPSPPLSPPPVYYYVDYYDPVTGLQSTLSPVLEVTPGNSTVASYPDAFMASGGSPGYTGNGYVFGANNTRVFNTTAGIAMPLQDEVGQTVTVTCTAPAFSAAAVADGVTARLWKDTASGRRLIASVGSVTAGSTVTFVDNAGVGELATQLYEAGGTAPALTCLTAAQGRLVGGLGQRLWISSFIPPSTTDSPSQCSISSLTEVSTTVTAVVTGGNAALSDGVTVTVVGATPAGYNGTFVITIPLGNTTGFTYQAASGLSTPATGYPVTGYVAPANPLPQWPPIPLGSADGWAYDVYPSSLEQIQCVSGDGDAVYIFTQETCYSLTDLTPGATPSLVFRRGALGAHACCYAEDRVFWAAYDGIYMAEGVARASEMTSGIRLLYLSWLAPDARVSMAYQSRKLFVFQPQASGGTRYLRYDFVVQKWTRGTLADSVYAAVFWMGTVPGGHGAASDIEQLWMLTSGGWVTRWQPGATMDNQGSTSPKAIPPWRFSTGFLLESIPFVVKGILLDSTAACSVLIAKTTAAADLSQARTVTLIPVADADEVWMPAPADFRMMKVRFEIDAGNTVSVNRAMFSIEAISEGHGG